MISTSNNNCKMEKMKSLKFILIVMLCLVQQVASSQPAPSGMRAYVDALMKKMTLEEKIGQLNLLTPGGGIVTGAVVSSDVESKIQKGQVGGLFGVIGQDKIRQAQQLAISKSRLKIPMIFGSDVIHGYKTTFPIPLGISCSWDIPLIERSARIAAIEASADGLCWVFSPMVDIARDPRWGRIAEGSGEDPFLGSKIAAAMVRGYQGSDLSADNTVMACVKHFALYGASEAGRDYNTVDMGKVRMYNEYLPPYKAAVDAGVGSVMSSFNEIDGVPATGNKWLLTELLRNQWGFKGFVVSDYTSVNEMIAHGMGNLQQVSALALRAGLDMDMVGEGFLTTLNRSLSQGMITLKNIDDACRRILEAKYKLGLFQDPFKYCNAERSAREVLSADKRSFAREIARKSYVLLKNNDEALPLKRSGKIALIGPLANNKNNMLGTWAVSGDFNNSVPVLDGMKAVGGSAVTVEYAKGANITDDPVLAKKANEFGLRADIDSLPSATILNNALEVAKRSDVIVAVIGEASEFSGEASSRTDISIPPSQKKLVAELAATGKPLVLVVMSGRPLDLSEESEKATAILQVWHSGFESGNAIADVLFGEYNPSGKLTATFPRNVGQVPIYYSYKNTGRPQPTVNWQKFVSAYLDAPNTPLYPFGYGLSYTKFEYSDLKLSDTVMRSNGKITATINVKNTGNYDGEETVQLYIRDMVGSVTRPVKELKGFQKVYIQKGQAKQVSFSITNEELKFYNSDLKHVSEPGEFKVFIGTNSSDVKEAGFVLK